jgi:hypothetical protein
MNALKLITVSNSVAGDKGLNAMDQSNRRCITRTHWN